MTTKLSTFEQLQKKIKIKQFTIGIVGLGYVGLPLVHEFIKNNIKVIGFDILEDKISQLNNGQSYIQDISNKDINFCNKSGNFLPTTDFSKLSETDVISICVPTPLRKTKDPDMSYIISAINNISTYLKKGQLVILESTTYPGTTDELIKPTFEDAGFTIGKDLFLAFSPERVDPGNKTFKTKNTPKIVGGITKNCTQLACDVYNHAVDQTVPVTSARTAELVKLYENTFRSVNIALANEMALISNKLNIDVWEVINAASTKPFGFMPFYPGPGLGGHCIPIDPSYLSWKMKSLNYETRFVSLAEQINTNMPNHVIQTVGHALNSKKKAINGASILALGSAYKKDINDARESPAVEILKQLHNLGASLMYNDDFIPTLSISKTLTFHSESLSNLDLKSFDCILIITDHSYFDIPTIVSESSLIVDTRNATKNIDSNKVFKI